MAAAKLNTFVHSLRTMRFGATFIFVSSVRLFFFFSVCRRCQRLYRLFCYMWTYVNRDRSINSVNSRFQLTVSNLRVVNSVGVAFVLENLKSFCRNRRQKCIFMDAAKFSLFFLLLQSAYETRPYIVLSEFVSSLISRTNRKFLHLSLLWHDDYIFGRLASHNISRASRSRRIFFFRIFCDNK